MSRPQYLSLPILCSLAFALLILSCGPKATQCRSAGAAVSPTDAKCEAAQSPERETCDPKTLYRAALRHAEADEAARAFEAVGELLLCPEGHTYVQTTDGALEAQLVPLRPEATSAPRPRPTRTEEPAPLLRVVVANGAGPAGKAPCSSLAEALHKPPAIVAIQVETNNPAPKTVVWYRDGLEAWARHEWERVDGGASLFMMIDWAADEDFIVVWGEETAFEQRLDD